MKLPICGFDAKNAVLCPSCEGKVESGQLTKADITASMNLADIAKSNKEFENFTLYSCKEFDGNFILSLARDDILLIRQSYTLYGILREKFKKPIWLVEANETDRQFIEDLFFPVKILSVNAVWAPGGIEKTKAVISGKRTRKFPIDTDKVIDIARNIRNLDIEIEFEVKG